MAIEVSDLYVFIKSKLDELKEEYWSETDIFLAINIAVSDVFSHTLDIYEEMYLKQGTVTATIDNKEFDLPARTIYVSSFCDTELPDNEVDYRPKWTTAQTVLDLNKDYFIGGSNGEKFVLKTASTVNDTIDIWYKQMPAMVNDTGNSIDLPNILWHPIVEIAVLHAKAKDENITPELAPLISAALRKVRGRLAELGGKKQQIKAIM